MSSSSAPQRIHFTKSDFRFLHRALNNEIMHLIEDGYSDHTAQPGADSTFDWYKSIDEWEQQAGEDKSKPIMHSRATADVRWGVSVGRGDAVIEYYDEKQLIKKMDKFYELHHLQIKMSNKCPELYSSYPVMEEIIKKWEKEFGLKSRIPKKRIMKEKTKTAKIAIIAEPDDRIGCYFQQHYTPDFEEPQRQVIKKTCLYKVNKITKKRVFVDRCFKKSIDIGGVDGFPFRFDVEKNKSISKTDWDNWNVVKVDYDFEGWENNQREAVARLISLHNQTTIYG